MAPFIRRLVDVCFGTLVIIIHAKIPDVRYLYGILHFADSSRAVDARHCTKNKGIGFSLRDHETTHANMPATAFYRDNDCLYAVQAIEVGTVANADYFRDLRFSGIAGMV